MEKKMKAVLALVCLLAVCPAFTACGKQMELSAENTSENTVLIRQDGTVEQYITEKFQKDYYNVGDLTEFAKKKISGYNEKADGKRVSLVSVQREKEIVTMLLEYQSVEDYLEFNSVPGSYMTAEEAEKEGMLPETLYSPSGNGEEIPLEEVTLDSGWYVFSLSEDTDIRFPGEIKYYSNAVLLNQKAVKAEGKETAVIIFKV